MILIWMWHGACLWIAATPNLYPFNLLEKIMIKKSLMSAALAASMLVLSAPASATLTNWYVDTDGAGGNAAVAVQDYLDLNGRAYVHNTFTSATTFNFNEVGSFLTVLADGATPLSPLLTSQFVGSGSGTLGGSLSFNAGGTLTVFSGATQIATFTLLEGSANLVANSTLPNGTVSLIFKATSLATGYFFDQYMNDLAAIANSPEGLVLGFATTNAISLPQTVDASLVTAYNTAFNPDVTGPITPNGSTDLFLSNNGQFRMSVPEPSTLSLFGLALVGFGFSARRKAKN